MKGFYEKRVVFFKNSPEAVAQKDTETPDGVRSALNKLAGEINKQARELLTTAIDAADKGDLATMKKFLTAIKELLKEDKNISPEESEQIIKETEKKGYTKAIENDLEQAEKEVKSGNFESFQAAIYEARSYLQGAIENNVAIDTAKLEENIKAVEKAGYKELIEKKLRDAEEWGQKGYAIDMEDRLAAVETYLQTAEATGVEVVKTATAPKGYLETAKSFFQKSPDINTAEIQAEISRIKKIGYPQAVEFNLSEAKKQKEAKNPVMMNMHCEDTEKYLKKALAIDAKVDEKKIRDKIKELKGE